MILIYSFYVVIYFKWLPLYIGEAIHIVVIKFSVNVVSGKLEL